LSASQKRDVEELLGRNGWRISSRDAAPEQWWLDEQWVLESQRSPQGTAYASFLVDPQAPTERRSGEHVWAVAITRHCPSGWLEATPAVALRPNWQSRNLEELAQHVEALRRRVRGDAGEQ
jgi:hypothetical protein